MIIICLSKSLRLSSAPLRRLFEIYKSSHSLPAHIGWVFFWFWLGMAPRQPHPSDVSSLVFTISRFAPSCSEPPFPPIIPPSPPWWSFGEGGRGLRSPLKYRCSTPEGTTLLVLQSTFFFGTLKSSYRHRFHRFLRL